MLQNSLKRYLFRARTRRIPGTLPNRNSAVRLGAYISPSRSRTYTLLTFAPRPWHDSDPTKAARQLTRTPDAKRARCGAFHGIRSPRTRLTDRRRLERHRGLAQETPTPDDLRDTEASYKKHDLGETPRPRSGFAKTHYK